MVVLTPFDP
jgi:hypothetical protein